MNLKPEDWDPKRPLGTGQRDTVAADISYELRKQLPPTQAEALALYGPLEFTHIQMDEPDNENLKPLYFLTSLAQKPDLFFWGFEYGNGVYFKRYVDHAMVEQGPWQAFEKRIPVPEGFKRARIPWLTEKGEVIIGDITHSTLDGEGPSGPYKLVPKIIKKKILVVEDERNEAWYIKDALEQFGFIVEFLTKLPFEIDDAGFQALIARSSEFAAIVWDYRMETNHSADGYVQAFAQIYKGPMIANSSNSHAQDRLRMAGCQHHNIAKIPGELGKLLTKILGK